MKTFYIASSSEPAYRLRVKALAELLTTKFGWKWHNDWDWNYSFDNREEFETRESLVRCAQLDKEGARDCDVFIYIEPEVRSLGANREYGVRWGMGLPVYRISNGHEEHIFDMSPLVTSFPDEISLINELSRSEV